jgi:type IV pilus assembly protein PilM
MALSLGKRTPRGSVGLDLDGGYVAAVRADSGRVLSAVSEELPEGLVKDGDIADAAGLADFLKRFFATHDLPKRVWLGVANQQIVMRQLELPLIEDEQELAAAVRFQAAEAIAMPLDETVLDYQVLGAADGGEGGARLRAVVVGAREAMIERFVAAVRNAGLKPAGIDLNAFALVRTLAPQGQAEADESARVYCHLGGVTNLAVAVGSNCLFTRPLSTNWYEEGNQAGAALAEEIRLSIDFYMAQPDARPAAEVVLSGPGSLTEGLPHDLEAALRLPVRVADPLGKLEASAISGEPEVHRYTVAAGLAMGAAA